MALVGLWLLLLAGAGYTRRWTWVAILNGIPIVLTTGVYTIAIHEKTDPASLGALALSGLASLITASCLGFTLLGWFSRQLNDMIVRKDQTGQEN